MHDNFDFLMDKSQSDWFNSTEKDDLLTSAQREYVNTRYREFEVDERAVQDLHTLVRTYTQGLGGTGIVLSNVTDFLYVASLKGTFNIAYGSTTKAKERNIKKAQFDDVDDLSRDPFNKATNEYPLYVQDNTQIVIFSDSPSTSLTLRYVKVPTSIDAVNTPNGSPELPENTHRSIVEIAVRKAKAITENPQGYQVQQNEVLNTVK